ncbi:hypothetical protein BUALT_Bualt14G0008100 [Buddleja alternifolia]|uniref:DUF4005 domain-containing protein n=1 Tax=Buddleja alternifolia TaxID=168488 RepID=A0AAV6WNH1_9LAMI|nr:hypothetical protein BUALT_Bualt14G0008100 [Buddleja alternifolia]
MGKKGSWFSAIKRVFTHNSSDKASNESNKKSSKEKKKGIKHGETKSFIPLFREPSSIEKILGEADQLLIRPPPTSSQLPKISPPLPWRPTSPKVASPKAASPKAASPKTASPKTVSPNTASPRISALKAPAISPKPSFTRGAASSKTTFSKTASSKTPSSSKVTKSHKEISYVQRAEPTLRNQHLSATKIQAAYRGYMARRSFRALKGLVRLQGVVRGQNVKRQTMNAMKQMQLLVRVQTQIQSRRIQMFENQQQAHTNDNDVESTFSKWTFNQMSEAGNNEDWDDSSLTKEEVEKRLQKKVEAVIKRERAMAYAYSHQLWKANPKSAQGPPDMRSNGYPWWWNWLERQLPPPSASHHGQTPFRNVTLTPPRPVSEYKASPLLKHRNFTFDNHESLTPRSSWSPFPARSKQFHTPSRTPPPPNTSRFINYSKPRRGVANSSTYDIPLRDDSSLTSCPPFSVPNYMSPTVSAKAKVRTNSNPKERLMGTPSNGSKRRFSFPLTPNVGSFKWNKGSNKESASPKVVGKHHSSRSIGEMSVDSAVSMPSLVGRKPFNRFV